MKKFSKELFFAEQPAETDLEQWARQGVQTVVNLRLEEEVERGLSPESEAVICQKLGLKYYHLATALGDLDKGHLRNCRDRLESAPRPMVIHCAGGARAAILTAVLHAWACEVPGEQVVEMVEQSGQSFNHKLRAKVVELAQGEE